MKNTLFMLVIGLFFGTGLGFLLSQAPGAEMPEGHDHSAHGVPHDDHGALPATAGAAGVHDHSQLVEAGTPAPSVDFHALPEGGGGVNLHIMADNFAFAPEAVNGADAQGQGHAHVYVDGIKVLRAYSPWVHLAGIRPGEVEIRVTLNSNSHGALATDGTPIEAVRTVTVE